ncbi:hypothetical protein QUF65_05115 [Lysinibacillus sphaericus]|uniref:hypothetical protein n=1 Tax=Lysinibacillus sphaericus TaxID=1421 RepID=UPI0025A2E939|nr:hypothetical protein [Lysinibacillus sphaericus]MDM5350259.1 hypothetical protein [Lysinibacillus sphaericus]MEB7455830.1 hypothetical protein [Lysinibacillus sphaericus]
MKINTLDNLNGRRDVFEFMHGDFKSEHWHESSIYLTTESFDFLHLFIEEVLPDFNYFGPNSVNQEQWNQIAFNACSLNNTADTQFLRFFNKIDHWVKENFKEHTCFSICGP